MKKTKLKALYEYESFKGHYRDNPFTFDEFFKVECKTLFIDGIVILGTCSIMIGIAIYIMRHL
jgi:hypothetical protein